MSIQLTPDIEAGLRAEAAARGMEVDALVATAVRAWLRETPPSPSTRVSARDRSSEMAWASSPDVQFVGKWVVLEGCQVVASGSNPKQLYEDVRAGGSLTFPHLCFSRRRSAVRRRMDRLNWLDFDADFGYEESAAGILVPIRLIHDGQSVELSAPLDTGAGYCLFDRFYADKHEDGEPLKDFDLFKLAMTQIVGKGLAWDRLTGKETVLPTCLNC